MTSCAVGEQYTVYADNARAVADEIEARMVKRNDM